MKRICTIYHYLQNRSSTIPFKLQSVQNMVLNSKILLKNSTFEIEVMAVAGMYSLANSLSEPQKKRKHNYENKIINFAFSHL